jgi:AraC-like DNA-binding protein
MWQTIRVSAFGRHVHEKAYASLVLAGEYEEAGDFGRFRIKAGDVVFHEPFEAHLDRFTVTGAVVLNLKLADCSSARGIARVPDPDYVARIAEKSPENAVALLLSIAKDRLPQLTDWPDELAAELVQNPSLKLSQWAVSNGIALWTVSRGFASAFGVTPEAFRARVRARHALKLIQKTQTPLASIAAELDFADQSHMTRSVKQLTGTAPQGWRLAANGFKTRNDYSV